MNNKQPCPVSEADLLLLAYGEGGKEAAAHAAECPRCRSFLDEVRAVREQAKLLTPTEPAEAAVNFVRAEARKAATQKRRPGIPLSPAWRPLALAATLILVVVAAWYALDRKPGPEPIERAAWISPVNLATLESELESGLPEIGLRGDALELEGTETTETYSDAAVADALATAASLPTGDGLEVALAGWGFYRDEEALDRMEVTLAEMESDLGITEGM